MADGVCVVVRVCDEVMVMMMMVVGDKRGIVYSCPARVVGTLASRSPCFAAWKRGPSGISFIGLHAGIVE